MDVVTGELVEKCVCDCCDELVPVDAGYFCAMCETSCARLVMTETGVMLELVDERTRRTVHDALRPALEPEPAPQTPMAAYSGAMATAVSAMADSLARSHARAVARYGKSRVLVAEVAAGLTMGAAAATAIHRYHRRRAV